MGQGVCVWGGGGGGGGGGDAALHACVHKRTHDVPPDLLPPEGPEQPREQCLGQGPPVV